MRDSELDDLRGRVDCRAVLEHAGWSLDAPESTENAAKYRGGPAQIVIVTHRGRGWFDPLNDRRGDVLSLAQHLWGGSIGHARKALRPLAGIEPKLRPRPGTKTAGPLDAPVGWDGARRLTKGSAGWAYLTSERGLPESTVHAALADGVLREGIGGTVWAVHRGIDEQPCGWEMRGPRYKGFSKGGGKALFWVGAIRTAARVVVTESAIDALSLATIEQWPTSVVYVSTGGGFGPETATTLVTLVDRSARLVAATDQGRGGDLLADRLQKLAEGACAGFSRLRPIAKDWNDQLIESRGPK